MPRDYFEENEHFIHSSFVLVYKGPIRKVRENIYKDLSIIICIFVLAFFRLTWVLYSADLIL